MSDIPESRAIAERYARRTGGDRYSAMNPEVLRGLHERQEAMCRIFERNGWRDLSGLRLFEVGCGTGGNLLELLRLGFKPENLSGIELLPERWAEARHVLPGALDVHEGDATTCACAPASQDIVFVSTVFSSLLDHAYQESLAAAMWRWTKPGGGVLWYDFIVDNPANADVRGVPVRRIRSLFPEGTVRARRVTLAPPLARAVSAVSPGLYTLLNAFPMLRTHVLAWVAKA